MKRAALVLATSVALFLSGVSVSAATRVPTAEPPFAEIMNAAQGAVGLPYGDPAFFGPEFTAEHSAGSRFQPGSVTGQFPPGAAPKVKVPIKPVVTINPAKLASAVKSAIKGGGVPGILAQAAVLWAIDQIPGAEVSSDGSLVKVPSVQTSPLYYWDRSSLAGLDTYTDPDTACRGYRTLYPYQTWQNVQTSSTKWTCKYWDSYLGTTVGVGNADRREVSCPLGHNGSTCYSQTPEPVPFTDADFDALEPPLSSITNSDWLRDLTKAKCAGSLSPERCYQDLVDRRPNQGPSSQLGPKQSYTTTTKNPDGTTSSTTTTSQNKYDYTYTQNSFNYTVTNTTSVTHNGQTTTEVTTEEPLAPGEQPQEEPKDEDEEMPEVTDLYKPYIDKLKTIETDIAAAPGVTAPIGYSSWYAFGGGCSEISAELPVIGSWQTNYCPLIYDWVRPVLAFIFVMFTWHYCRSLWSEAVTQARPM